MNLSVCSVSIENVPLLEMRDLLARTSHLDVTRLDDHQVRKAAGSLARSGVCLRNLSDLRRVLEFLARAGAGDRIALRVLFDRAIDLLDFHVDAHQGLIYAGQYGTYGNRMRPDDRLTEEIRAAAPLPSGAAGKTTIAHTAGGRWLLGWNLRHLLGATGEDAVWAHATRRFIDALTGDVEVLLAASEFDNDMLRLPWHPLYEVPGVRKVIYYLDDDVRRISNPPKELFETGVVKKAHGKELIFRAKK